jgi:hypothetical protein
LFQATLETSGRCVVASEKDLALASEQDFKRKVTLPPEFEVV